MTRGAFVNVECLYVDAPVNYTMVADEDTTLLALTRHKFKEMELHSPELAFEIHKSIMRYIINSRNRMQRELTALDQMEDELDDREATPLMTFSLSRADRRGVSSPGMKKNRLEGLEGPKSPRHVGSFKHIGAAVQKLSAVSSETYDADHHHRSHAFHHIDLNQMKSLESKPKNCSLEHLTEKDHQPHLSSKLKSIVRDCFHYHDAEAKGITLEVVVEAVMDLGYYPGPLELAESVATVHQEEQEDDVFAEETTSCSSSSSTTSSRESRPNDIEDDVAAAQKVSEKGESDALSGRDDSNFLQSSQYTKKLLYNEQDFTKIVERIALGTLSPQMKVKLRDIFERFANQKCLMTKSGLADVMQALGHPESSAELNVLMSEWADEGNQWITYNAFVSIMASFIKAERLQADVEKAFLAFAHSRRPTSLLYRSPKNAFIYPLDVVALFRSQSMEMPLGLAEEMVYDADYEGDGRVDFEEFMSTIEIVHESELVTKEQPGRALSKPDPGTALPTAPSFDFSQPELEAKLANTQLSLLSQELRSDLQRIMMPRKLQQHNTGTRRNRRESKGSSGGSRRNSVGSNGTLFPVPLTRQFSNPRHMSSHFSSPPHMTRSVSSPAARRTSDPNNDTEVVDVNLSRVQIHVPKETDERN